MIVHNHIYDNRKLKLHTTGIDYIVVTLCGIDFVFPAILKQNMKTISTNLRRDYFFTTYCDVCNLLVLEYELI